MNRTLKITNCFFTKEEIEVLLPFGYITLLLRYLEYLTMNLFLSCIQHKGSK